MTPSRRAFLAAAALAAARAVVPPSLPARPRPFAGPASSTAPLRRPPAHDPWIEVDAAALARNAREVARAAGDRPVLAVVKNNAYGLGLEEVARGLDGLPEVAGLAVVKVEEAVRLRDAGARKPVLFMGLADGSEAEELARRDVRLAPFSDEDADRLPALARRLGRPLPVHLYLDTGMSRLGMPYHRALPWIERLAREPAVRVEGTFTTFTEDGDFDREQLERFVGLAEEARSRNLSLGRLHAASSHAVTFLPDAHLDMVRPGLMLYGAHVSGGRERGAADLAPAFRLRARVVRVERLRPGDSVSYGRGYVARSAVWIATLPVGHADGYPREAVRGCRVLIGGRTYPVIGAVSASHTIVEVGAERAVAPGDPATLLGPDHPDVHPNVVAEITGRSVYDVLMHLSPALPKASWA